MITSSEQLAAWLGRLVALPSVTPEQAGPRATTPGEARLAQALASWFREFGGEVEIEEVLPERPNVYGGIDETVALLKDRRQGFDGLSAPGAQHVGMHLVLGGQLANRLGFLEQLQYELSFERGAVNFFMPSFYRTLVVPLCRFLGPL